MKKFHHQQGAALLIILTLVVAAVVVLITSVLSVNSLRNKATNQSVDSLHQAYQAVLGYALHANPPGQLPCPDSDDDGHEDYAGGQCAVRFGRLPYVTLNLPELLDGYNSQIWYASNPNLQPTSGFAISSSTSTPLTVDGKSAAFVLISPGRSLDSQNRTASAAVSEYFEGVNADGNMNNFARVLDADHNDVLLSINYQNYWSLVEESVLRRVATMLNQYYTACGFYPWAASYAANPYRSIDALQQGNVPFDQALPTDWNSGCASGIEPLSWMTTEWGQEIYYAMCPPAQGDCLTISGDTSVSTAAILVAPGVPLSGQSRPSFAMNGYYESNNANADSQFTLRYSTNFDGSFNDVVISLPP